MVCKKKIIKNAHFTHRLKFLRSFLYAITTDTHSQQHSILLFEPLFCCFYFFPWLRVWKWLPMRSTSLAWEQKQRGEHIITSQRKTESCLPVCLRRCVRTFSTSAATAVSWGQRFLLEDTAEPEGERGRKHDQRKTGRQRRGRRYKTNLC